MFFIRLAFGSKQLWALLVYLAETLFWATFPPQPCSQFFKGTQIVVSIPNTQVKFSYLYGGLRKKKRNDDILKLLATGYISEHLLNVCMYQRFHRYYYHEHFSLILRGCSKSMPSHEMIVAIFTTHGYPRLTCHSPIKTKTRAAQNRSTLGFSKVGLDSSQVQSTPKLARNTCSS